MSVGSLRVGRSVVGRRGSSHVLQQILYQRPGSPYRLWLANRQSDAFVVKTVNPHQYHQAWRLQEELADSRFVRKPIDGVDDECALVFRYYNGNLLSFIRKKMASKSQIKMILRDALRGIRDLHSRDWVHGGEVYPALNQLCIDIKPSNILLSWRHGAGGALEILDVIVSDTEDAAKVLDGECIDNVKLGNVYWRNPEANFGNNIDHKTDIFSFGSVVIFALSARVIFAYDALKQGQTPEMAVITNQLSYFGHTVTKEFVTRFDDCVANVIADIFESFNETGRTPFSTFAIDGLDANDRKFIERIMVLTPSARPSAEDLLQDTWWST